MRATYLLMLGAQLLIACAKSSGPSAGSETHFLSACETACGEPYSCVCGVCTLACDGAAICEDLSSAAVCIDAADPNACGEQPSTTTCDVECTDTADCDELGEGYDCLAGRCRHAQKDPTPAPAAGRSPGCDGTDEVWFGYTNGGGFVEPWYEFTNPYGFAYFFIDGHCDVYVKGFSEGLRAGHLEEDAAIAFAERLRYRELGAARDHDDEGCPDAGQATLRLPDSTAWCSCGCDEDAPQALVTAMARIQEELDWLSVQSMAYDGPLAVIALRERDLGPGEQDEYPGWPLVTAIADTAGLEQQLEPGEQLATAIVFVGQDARTLRTLWSPTDPAPWVREAGSLYRLLMVDVLAEGTAMAIDSFITASEHRQ